MKKNFSCYIIGESNLAIQYAEYLLDQGHKVLGIISSSILKSTQEWTAKNNVSYFTSFLEFQDNVSEASFDYLFSIINPQVISQEILGLPKKLAINFHDSPLPKYAGVYATSWAILNKELSHGITWHVMSNIVDGGDILKQRIFPIQDNETALSLNLKCYEQAFQAFKELVDELTEGRVERNRQDLSQRTYYGVNKKPLGNGLVRWDISAEEIERLYRSLYFGDYSNGLASLKLLIAGEVFIPKFLKILKFSSNMIPGTLVLIMEEHLQITTGTKDIVIYHLRDINGKTYTISELTKKFNLFPGKILPSLGDNLVQDFQKWCQLNVKYENFWVKYLKEIKPAVLPHAIITSGISNVQDNKIIKLQIKITKVLRKKLQNILKTQASISDVILTTFIIYLYKVGNEFPFSIKFSNTYFNEIAKGVEAFVEHSIPFKVEIGEGLSVKKVIEEIIRQKHDLENNKTYLKDITQRYPELSLVPYHSFSITITQDTNYKPILENNQNTIDIIIKGETGTLQLYFKENLNKEIKNNLYCLPKYIKTLLEAISNNLDKQINILSFLTQEEHYQVIREWNKTEAEYPQEKTLYRLFEEQVARTPDHLAVIYEDQQLTYQELNQRANQLAHYLRKQGVVRETLIAISLERSPELIISILGILKAGGAYVPLDPNYPEERLHFMLEDTGAP